jgi:hypothetical protein
MVFTNTGANEIRDWLAGSVATAPAYVAVGDTNTAETKSDTTLANELVRDTIDTTSTANKEITYEWTLLSTEQNGNNIKEVGLFNDPTTGDMFSRAIHATIAKTAAIEVRYRIRVRIIN